jgi:hypothetical protein
VDVRITYRELHGEFRNVGSQVAAVLRRPTEKSSALANAGGLLTIFSKK